MLKETIISKLLPQKEPFIYIDEIIEDKLSGKIFIKKNFTINEKNYMWTNNGVIPNTLIIEGASQSAVIFYKLGNHKSRSNIVLIGKINAEFQGIVSIGQVVNFYLVNLRVILSGGFVEIEAFVLDKLIAKIDVYFKL